MHPDLWLHVPVLAWKWLRDGPNHFEPHRGAKAAKAKDHLYFMQTKGLHWALFFQDDGWARTSEGGIKR